MIDGRMICGDCCDVSDLAAGIAAEHLVCADLILHGHRAFLADQNCPYDVAVEIGGRMVRVQVKSTKGPRAIPQRKNHRAGYLFYVRRSGKGGRRRYGSDDFDLLALVALDCGRIAYLPPSETKLTIQIRTHDDPQPPANGGRAGKTFGQFPLERALRGLEKRWERR